MTSLGCPIGQVPEKIDELVSHARSQHRPVVLTQDDSPVAAIISIDDLEALQRVQDEADIALCEKVMATSGPGLRHEEFMALLEAEDAARNA